MKGAQVWRRILHEGLIFDMGDAKVDAQLAKKMPGEIIKAPLIVDSTLSTLREFTDWTVYRNLAVPFSTFWIEGACTEGLWGAYLICDATMFHAFAFTTISGRPVGCVGMARVQITKDKTVVTDATGRPQITGKASEELIDTQGFDASTACVHTILSFACDALRMLGCKNVALKSNDNDPKEVRRAIQRHGTGANDYRYHTLVVRPPGARSDAPAQDIGIMPRHVCRGHFSEYGPEFNKGLLFGKYAGRFYIPPHMKGKKENGVVEKDYAIAAMA